MANPITLAGIKNCDSVRSAKRWLDDNKIDYNFLDLRSDQFVRHTLEQWLKLVDWEDLLNKRSATWRGLDEKDRDDLDEGSAIALMLQHPTVIKRPVLHLGNAIEIGFDAERYVKLLKS